MDLNPLYCHCCTLRIQLEKADLESRGTHKSESINHGTTPSTVTVGSELREDGRKLHAVVVDAIP